MEPTNNAAPMTEASALLEILEWSQNRPAWQRDALRRLVTNGGISTQDLGELYAICIDADANYSPLSKEHIATEALPNEPVSLVRINDPVGINALAPDQSLEFASNGLTIVYGDNGSGKSGYVRVLKHACRSRDEKVKILPEIGGTESNLQSAKIHFNHGDIRSEMDWSPKEDGRPELTAVSIFDSKSASTHVEQTNNVAYTPFPMQALQSLADTCDIIKSKIKDQTNALDAQTPQAISSSSLSPNSPAGSFLSSISAESNRGTLRLLVKLSRQEEARLTALEGDLSQDSAQAVARLSSLKGRLSADREMFANLADAASEEFAKKVNALQEDRDDTAKLAKAASEALFAASSLPEIGGKLWKSLWDAAKEYSNQIAYRESKFPEATADEDLCVLCHQPLDEEATKRWETFEEFIKGKTKANEVQALEMHEAAIAEARAALPAIGTIKAALRLIRLELNEPELSRSIRRSAFLSIRKVTSLIEENTAHKELSLIPIHILDEKVDEIVNRMSALRSGESSPVRLALMEEHRDLKDRVSLRALEADVNAEIDRQVKKATLTAAAKTAAKTSITNKNKELSNKLVTDSLRNRFAREVQKLEIGTMPIELRKVKDSNAQSFFRVSFVAQPNEPLGDILSEGEHRCVALAAFLAELVTSRDYSGIVFDDPMSSLDHLYRQRVAIRLVEEATHRQVVVFTHDLGFLFEMMREAESQGTSPSLQSISRKNDRPGYVDSDLPMKAKNAASRAAALQTELKQIKGQFDNWSDVYRKIFCKGFIEQLREVWDQAIADFIHPVLGRFDNKIKGTSIYKLAVLTEQDLATVAAARGRLSKDLHATSETLNPEETTHEQLGKEVKIVIAWLADINTRQSNAKKPAMSYSV